MVVIGILSVLPVTSMVVHYYCFSTIQESLLCSVYHYRMMQQARYVGSSAFNFSITSERKGKVFSVLMSVAVGCTSVIIVGLNSLAALKVDTG